MNTDIQSQFASIFQDMQSQICNELERLDGKARFKTDPWERPDMLGQHGGGGNSCVMTDGAIFEKAGVNFSKVHGTLPAEMVKLMTGGDGAQPFSAVGTSLVIHPLSPMVPTIHANCRHICVGEKHWTGGGIDLTPYVFFEEDARSFHGGLKALCDVHDKTYYPKFKKDCDEYFTIKHRGETRGIGGIFFDYLGRENPESVSSYFAFVKDIALGFNSLYSPIVERRKGLSWSDQEKRFQLIRRGRYVEFNLVYDRGTLFGLKTQGRSESILMSLPLHASWEYDYQPEPGSAEAAYTAILREPREWALP